MKNNSLSLEQYSDEELVAETQSGSRHSYEQLVYRYSRRLFFYLRPKMSTDQDTEDIIQETFIKIYNNINRYNPQYKFSTWLYTVAVRLVISFYRKKHIREIFLLSPEPASDRIEPEEIPNQQDPQERLMKEDDMENIWSFAQSLHPDQYQALWLRYIEDLPLKDIAGVMKKNQVHIRVLLHRARLNLIKQFNPRTNSELTKTETLSKVNFSFFL